MDATVFAQERLHVRGLVAIDAVAEKVTIALAKRAGNEVLKEADSRDDRHLRTLWRNL